MVCSLIGSNSIPRARKRYPYYNGAEIAFIDQPGRRILDRLGRSGRKMLVQRFGSGHLHKSRNATWGMSARLFLLKANMNGTSGYAGRTAD